ncbi:MAG: MFS transporter [Alphaproteobacteria bacterium]|nr:MFS transporter [Alphaproteobacteria bacterium]
MPLFLTIILIDFLVAAEMDILVPSFPSLQAEFSLTPFLVQFVISANGIFYAISSLFMGPLGDRFGRKQIIISGLCVFVLGCLLCFWADTYTLVILGRVLQGIGMAGSAVLVFVIVSDEYPKHKQTAMFAQLNGIITLGMAVSPLLGNYINAYFGWKGNIGFLFVLALINIVFCAFFIPKKVMVKTKNTQISFSLKAYMPLLKSQEFLRFALTVCLLDACYWTFVGMSSILYIEDMGVPFSHFAYYQGAVAAAFALASFGSPFALKYMTPQKCLTLSLYASLVLGIIMVAMGIFVKDTPLYISIVICLFSMVLVFPINIAYPKALGLHPEFKGRAGAFINIGILLFTALGLQSVSYIYGGKFVYLALFILLCIIAAFILMPRQEINGVYKNISH